MNTPRQIYPMGFALCLLACGQAAPPPATAPSAAPAAPPPATVDAPAPTAEPETETPTETEGALCKWSTGEELAACDGKIVEIRGTKPRRVSQHPKRVGPVGPDGKPPAKQGYLDVPDVGQISVISKEKLSGCDEYRVVGTLERVDLGGEPGTKSSYKGLALYVSEQSCVEP